MKNLKSLFSGDKKMDASKSVPTTTTTAVVKKKRKEIVTEFKPKLILTKEFLDKVDFLHDKVEKNIEWSAMLLYKNTKGSVDDPLNWEITVTNLILMDVGTSGYTEYDMSASDESNDIWMDHLEEGGKVGHLHTHHNMNCFFSGTDMGELHDNAPMYNYYLSLIVNYKDVKDWCAKVAICGEESVIGTQTVSKSWKGANGPMSKVETKEIKETEEVLYLMECKLEGERTTYVDEALDKRLNEILKAKQAKKAASYSVSTGYKAGVVFTGHNSYRPLIGKSNIKTPPPRMNAYDMDDDWGSFDAFGSELANTNLYTKGSLASLKPVYGAKYSPEICEPIFAKLLMNDLNFEGSLTEALLYLEDFEDIALEDRIEMCEDGFVDHLDLFFKEELTISVLHCIVVSMYHLINGYEMFKVYDYLDIILGGHLLEESEIKTSVVKTLTGLNASDQLYIESEDEKR